MRESNRRVNLSFALGQSRQVSISALIIMLQESLIIDKVSTGRNCLIVDGLPVIRRHLTLYNVNVLTHLGQPLTILLRRHFQILHDNTSILTGLSRTGVLRRQPLSHQRNRLPCQVISIILSHLRLNQLQNRSRSSLNVQQRPQIIPTRILRNHGNNLLHQLMLTILSQVNNAYTEQITLTKALTNIGSISQPTHSIDRILIKSFTELGIDFLIGLTTQRSHSEVQVQQLITSGLITPCTILSASQIGIIISIIPSLLKVLHKGLTILGLTSILGNLYIRCNLVSRGISTIVIRRLLLLLNFGLRCPRLRRVSLTTSTIINVLHFNFPFQTLLTFSD